MSELCTGEPEGLAPAIQMVGAAEGSRPTGPVTYVHLMFHRHQIVRSHGVWTETLQPGSNMLQS